LVQTLHRKNQEILVTQKCSRYEEKLSRVKSGDLGLDSQSHLQDVIKYISAKENGTKELVSAILREQFELTVKGKSSEDKSQLWEKSCAKRNAFIDSVNESFKNHSMVFSEKKTLCRYSSHTIQLAMCLYLRSKTNYEAFRSADEGFVWPSGSLLAKYKFTKKHNSGVNCEIYSNARTRCDLGGCVDGAIMCDEMKLIAGVAFHSSSHEVTGFTDELFNFGDLGAVMFEGKEDTKAEEEMPSNLATHVNVWKFRLVVFHSII
jgi:hypothetical protein